MNKTAIKNFAVWARNKLIDDITYKAGLIGVSEKGIAHPLTQSSKDLQFFDIGTRDYVQVAGSDIEQRNALVRAIKEKESTSDYQTAFNSVVEEVAYTWFNRLIAIRFMEVNDYLPSKIRVLSSENPAKNEPDFVTTPFDTDMEFTIEEQNKIIRLKDENKLDELFRMLFIKQCNKLHEILPELFEETNNYTELLLTISFTDNDGVVYHLVHDIIESDFDVNKEGQVEIIGWMYQYYNTELNEQVYDGNMSKSRIPKELLPAATTIYTPDWAIHYMVENSLGRLWVENHPDDTLSKGWKYFLPKKGSEIDTENRIQREVILEDIKVIDPCMGSGHILVCCFELLMQIYESQGYTQREAAQSIIENNLFGLDIDKRAAQLAYFAVMMKARQYDRRILMREINPHIYAIEESNSVNRDHLKYFGVDLSPSDKTKGTKQLLTLLNEMNDAKEYGSILNISKFDYKLLSEFVTNIDDIGQLTLDFIGIEDTRRQIQALLNCGHVMTQTYHVVVTNPPYLGSPRYSPKLDKYIKSNYSEVKSDLSMVMYKHALDSMSILNGFVSFITTNSWMSLSRFESLRNHVLRNHSFDSIVDFGTELFDGKVGHNPIVAWVNRVLIKSNRMIAIRLVDFCYSQREQKQVEFFNKKNYYYPTQENFSKLPGMPIAYSFSDKVVNLFINCPPLSQIATTRLGMTTADNKKFTRLWFEVDLNRCNLSANSEDEFINSNKKWVPLESFIGRR